MAIAPQAARSIHLWYPAPEANCFCNELTIEQSTSGSYFMACGFKGGYFGIQENPQHGKRALFSVWDAWKGDDKNAVPEGRRVETVAQGDGVQIGRFGNEGTGGQCFFPYQWAIGQPNRFLVTVAIASARTEFAGYLYVANAWKHLVTFSTPTVSNLIQLYSFVEDFRRDGRSALEVRRATFGNGWVRDVTGTWHDLQTARFTASNNPKEAQATIDAGISSDRFYLQNGGATQQSVALQSVLRRPAGEQPTDFPV